MIQTLIYPLSGIVGNTMEALRMSSAKMGGTISMSAFALACFFFGIRLIKMYYDVASDEQHGGFGGVRVWDILRPILILLMISGYSWLVVKPVDSLASYASGLVGAGKSMSFSAGAEKLSSAFSDAKKEKDRIKNGNDPSQADITEDEPALSEDSDKGGWLERVLDKYFGGVKKVKIWWSAFIASTTRGLGNIVNALLIWWFNIMSNVIRIFSDIMLNMLVLIGPLMMAFSIFDRWKGYTWTFIGQYVQLSMWKPLVGVICWCTTNATDVVCDGLGDSLVGTGSTWQFLGVLLGAIGSTVVITIAGIQMLKQVPGIANTLVSLATGLTAPVEAGTGAAGGLIGAGAGAVGGLAGGTAGAALGTIGGAGKGLVSGGLKGALSGAGSGLASGARAGAGMTKNALGKVGQFFGGR